MMRLGLETGRKSGGYEQSPKPKDQDKNIALGQTFMDDMRGYIEHMLSWTTPTAK